MLPCHFGSSNVEKWPVNVAPQLLQTIPKWLQSQPEKVQKEQQVIEQPAKVETWFTDLLFTLNP